MKIEFHKIAPFFLMVFIMVMYLPTISHHYTWDDELVITNNPITTKGFEGINEIWKTKSYILERTIYRPVPQTIFALTWHFFPNNPSVAHGISVFLYVFCCFSFLLLLKQFFTQIQYLWLFAIVLFFSVMPVHVEAVANIKSTDELLSALFIIWAFIFSSSNNVIKKLLSIVLFLLALLSKISAISLMPIFIFALFWDKQIYNLAVFLYRQHTKVVFYIFTFLVLFGLHFYFNFRLLDLALLSLVGVSLNFNQPTKIKYAIATLIICSLAYLNCEIGFFTLITYWFYSFKIENTLRFKTILFLVFLFAIFLLITSVSIFTALILIGVLGSVYFIKRDNSFRFFYLILPTIYIISLISNYYENKQSDIDWAFFVFLPLFFLIFKNQKPRFNIFVVILFILLVEALFVDNSFFDYLVNTPVNIEVNENIEQPKSIYYYNQPFHNMLVAADTQTEKIATIIKIQGVYLQKLVFPTHLVHHYGVWQIEMASWKDFDVYLVLVVLFGLTALLFFFYKHKHWLAFWGLLAFFVSLSLYSNVFFLMPDTLAERYLFLPSFGFSMFFVSGLVMLSKFIFQNKTLQNVFLAVLFVPLLSFNTYKTIVRSADWESNYTLAKNTLPFAENNAVINAQYALELQKIVQSNTNLNVDSANSLILNHYNKALQIYPNFYAVQAELATFYLNLGEVDSAYKYFSMAINTNENEWKNYFYLGMMDYQNQNYLKAIAYFDEVIKNKEIGANTFFQKELIEAYEFKARCLFNISKKQEAYNTLYDVISNFKQKSSFILLANMYRTDQNLAMALQTFKDLKAIFPYDDDLNNTILLLEDELKTQI